MSTLTLSLMADEPKERKAYAYGDEECSARIANYDAENGYDQEPGQLTWLNSARITTDPTEDAVHCIISVGDPRGGFCFTVRRLLDGGLIIHMPHPGEGLPHMALKELSPGTFEVGHYDPSAPLHYGGRADFSDPEPETPDDAVPDLLGACELISHWECECIDGEPQPHCAICVARAAITKARKE